MKNDKIDFLSYRMYYRGLTGNCLVFLQGYIIGRAVFPTPTIVSFIVQRRKVLTWISALYGENDIIIEVGIPSQYKGISEVAVIARITATTERYRSIPDILKLHHGIRAGIPDLRCGIVCVAPG